MASINITSLLKKGTAQQILAALTLAQRKAPGLGEALSLQRLARFLREVFTTVSSKENQLMKEHGGKPGPEGGATFAVEYEAGKEPTPEQIEAAGAKASAYTDAVKALHAEELELPSDVALPILVKIEKTSHLEFVRDDSNLHLAGLVEIPGLVEREDLA